MTTPRNYRILAVLAKIEGTYGTDAAPTGAANAIQLNNVTFTPLEGDEVTRDLMLTYLGNQGAVLSQMRGRMQFSVEIAGSGAAGTAPGYGTLLKACAMAEVITAGVSAAYSPVSAAYQSATFYWNHAGVQHVFTGARGTVSMDLTPNKIPYLKFDFYGLYGTVADVALPTAVLTAFQKPVMVNQQNTTATLFGQSLIAESVLLDLANKVEPRFLIGSSSIEITDRQATGTIVAQAGTIGAFNYFNTAVLSTRGSLAVTHGTVPGNIVQFACPQVEIGKIGQGQSQNIINYTFPLRLCPQNGNDELTITVA